CIRDIIISSGGIVTGKVIRNTAQKIPADFRSGIFFDNTLTPDDVRKAMEAKGSVTFGGAPLDHAQLTLKSAGKPSIIMPSAEWTQVEDKYALEITVRDDSGDENKILVYEGDVVTINTYSKSLTAVGALFDPMKDFREKIKEVYDLLLSLEKSKKISSYSLFKLLRSLNLIIHSTRNIELLKFIVQLVLIENILTDDKQKTVVIEQLISHPVPEIAEQIKDYILQALNIYEQRVQEWIELAKIRIPSTEYLTEVVFTYYKLGNNLRDFNKITNLLRERLGFTPKDFRQEIEVVQDIYEDRIEKFREQSREDLRIIEQKLDKEDLKPSDFGWAVRAIRQAESLHTYITYRGQGVRILAERIDAYIREEIARIELSESRNVLGLAQAGSYLAGLLGNKAAEVGEIRVLTQFDVEVPDGFVMTRLGIQQLLDNNAEAVERIQGVIDSNATRDEKLEQVTHLCLGLVNSLEGEITIKYHELENSLPLEDKIKEVWRLINIAAKTDKERDLLNTALSNFIKKYKDGVSVTLEEIIQSLSVGRDLKNRLGDIYLREGGVFVVVRSSSLYEDSPEAAMAGRFMSYLYIRGSKLILEHILRCLAYYWVEMGRIDSTQPVLIHRQVEADVSMVVSSINAMELNWKEAAISAAYGAGIGLVSGEVNSDLYTVDLLGKTTSRRVIAVKEEKTVFNTDDGFGVKKVAVAIEEQNRPALTDEEQIRIAQVARGYHKLYGIPIELEAVKRNGVLYVVQVRPLVLTEGILDVKTMAGAGILAPPLRKIREEKARFAALSKRAAVIAGLITDECIAELFNNHVNDLRNTRNVLIRIREIQYEVVRRLAVLEEYNYDEARIIAQGVLEKKKDEKKKDKEEEEEDSEVILLKNGGEVDVEKTLAELGNIKNILLPDLKAILRRFFIEDCGVSEEVVNAAFGDAHTFVKIKSAVNNIIRNAIEKSERRAESLRCNVIIRGWENRVNELIEQYTILLISWDESRKKEIELLYNDAAVPEEVRRQISPEELHKFIRWLFPRFYNVPRLKNLSHPTVVLVAGASGTGKSTIASFISNRLSISTYFSTDVGAREAVRKTLILLLGKDRAKETFPEIFGSSFDRTDLEWYYGHSIMTMVNVMAALDRLNKEGTSAVIEGVPLIPGLLPEKYFEGANIVWVVSSVSDPEEHFLRYAGRDARGGAGRYQAKFVTIRQIHDRLVDMAKLSETLVIDNLHSQEGSVDIALERVSDPYADRGLPVKDDVRDRVQIDLDKRRNDIAIYVQKEKKTKDNSSSPIIEVKHPTVDQVQTEIDKFLAKDVKRIAKLLRIEPPEGLTDKTQREQFLQEQVQRFITAVKTVPAGVIREILQQNNNTLYKISLLLSEIRGMHYELLEKLAVLPDFHYDKARQQVYAAIKIMDNSTTRDFEKLKIGLKRILFSEAKEKLREALTKRYNLSPALFNKAFANDKTFDDLVKSLETLIITLSEKDALKPYEEQDVRRTLSRWEASVDKLAKDYYQYLEKFWSEEDWATKSFYDHPGISSELRSQVTQNEFYYFVRILFLKTYPVRKVKSLTRPTIVLVAGASGTGKSTIASHISKKLSISTYFSTDVGAREAFRKTLIWILGKDRAKELFPAVFGSSFDKPELEWYYGHSIMTMVNVMAALDRLIKEGTSAVIEGVPLVPGLLPDRYFEDANIIWIVSSVSDPKEHFLRYAGRDARGGAGRYQVKFITIRQIHDRLVEMAGLTETLVIDNLHSQAESIKTALERVSDPYADRGLPVEDPIRDKVKSDFMQGIKNLGLAPEEKSKTSSPIEHLISLRDKLMQAGYTEEESELIISLTGLNDEAVDCIISNKVNISQVASVLYPLEERKGPLVGGKSSSESETAQASKIAGSDVIQELQNKYKIPESRLVHIAVAIQTSGKELVKELLSKWHVPSEYVRDVAFAITRTNRDVVRKLLAQFNIAWGYVGHVASAFMKDEAWFMSRFYQETINAQNRSDVNFFGGCFSVLPEERGSRDERLALVLSPLEGDLKIIRNKHYKDLYSGHKPGAFGYVEFRIIGDTIIVTNVQSDIFRKLGPNLQEQYKDWVRMLLLVLEDYARQQGIKTILITPSVTQLRLWQHFNPGHAFSVYAVAPWRLGYRLNAISDSILKDAILDLAWIEFAPDLTRDPYRVQFAWSKDIKISQAEAKSSSSPIAPNRQYEVSAKRPVGCDITQADLDKLAGQINKIIQDQGRNIALNSEIIGYLVNSIIIPQGPPENILKFLAGEEVQVKGIVTVDSKTIENPRIKQFRVNLITFGTPQGFVTESTIRPIPAVSTYTIENGELILNINMHKEYYERISKTNPNIIAQLIIHELLEQIEGFLHTEAVLAEAAYNSYETVNDILSDTTKDILESAANDGDFEYLKALSDNTEKYKTEVAAKVGISPEVVARAQELSERTKAEVNLLINLYSKEIKGIGGRVFTVNPRNIFLVRHSTGITTDPYAAAVVHIPAYIKNSIAPQLAPIECAARATRYIAVYQPASQQNKDDLSLEKVKDWVSGFITFCELNSRVLRLIGAGTLDYKTIFGIIGKMLIEHGKIVGDNDKFTDEFDNLQKTQAGVSRDTLNHFVNTIHKEVLKGIFGIFRKTIGSEWKESREEIEDMSGSLLGVVIDEDKHKVRSVDEVRVIDLEDTLNREFSVGREIASRIAFIHPHSRNTSIYSIFAGTRAWFYADLGIHTAKVFIDITPGDRKIDIDYAELEDSHGHQRRLQFVTTLIEKIIGVEVERTALTVHARLDKNNAKGNLPVAELIQKASQALQMFTYLVDLDDYFKAGQVSEFAYQNQIKRIIASGTGYASYTIINAEEITQEVKQMDDMLRVLSEVLNNELKRLGLEALPNGVVTGQNDVEQYFNNVIESGLREGSLIMVKGIPERVSANNSSSPVTESKKPTLLLAIFDGMGIGPEAEDNPLFVASSRGLTPNLDRVMKECPNTKLEASGEAVGLPKGAMGNSNDGHKTIGSGTEPLQNLVFINRTIKDGTFFKNPALVEAMRFAKEKNSRVHLLSLVSRAVVHASDEHLYALLELAKREGLDKSKVLIHAITDGRDSQPTDGASRMRLLKKKIQEIIVGIVATLSGRYYTMDRDKYWKDRIRPMYDLLTQAKGNRSQTDDPVATLEEFYETERKEGTDEFIPPTTLIGEECIIQNDDVVIFVNHRNDRGIELTEAFMDDNFTGFERKVRPKVKWVTMTVYDEKFDAFKNLSVAFVGQILTNTFGEFISKLGLKQLRASDTTKYPHVHFFFDGGRNLQLPGEDTICVDLPNVATFDLKPEMSVYELTEQVKEKMLSGQYDVIILNISNLDMVGHTGSVPATIQAVAAVDKCFGVLKDANKEIGGVILGIADHGNAEKVSPEDTSHSTAPVPCFVVDPAARLGKISLREGGGLSDVAPTMIHMLNIMGVINAEQPKEMTGESLIVKASSPVVVSHTWQKKYIPVLGGKIQVGPHALDPHHYCAEMGELFARKLENIIEPG
ncbi:MAG: 2,3-bisphosphoglycerate-independent phosphoglycerate mutase, partial [Candidatus Omnitrophica bacterium]|nr:2,3-bisphosphoglycerate-independent phosphoglycerate mutase [Candidatus Omnitrophota bacterium]